jgi:hypothetical protein
VASLHPGTAFARFVAPRAGSPLLAFLGLHSGSLRGGAVVAIKGGAPVAHAQLAQFGSGSSGSLAESALGDWLQHANVLERSPQPHEWDEYAPSTSSASRLGLLGSQKADEEEEFYDCGKAGCRKAFRHDHMTAGLPAAFVAQSGEA